VRRNEEVGLEFCEGIARRADERLKSWSAEMKTADDGV
jgi:hypothetical protein